MDSNHRMPESKSGALPLGESPISFSNTLGNVLENNRSYMTDYDRIVSCPVILQSVLPPQTSSYCPPVQAVYSVL